MRYKRNDGGDAFMDRLGRLWYTANESHLPKDPTEHETIPPQFWHPSARQGWEEEQSWIISIDRATQR